MSSSAAAQKLAAERRAHSLRETILQIGASRPLREIVAELTARGIEPPGGARWHANSVARVLRRLGLAPGIEMTAGSTRVLEPRSIDAVICSPPYAMQRKRQYGGISEADYPAWTVSWMEELRPALVPTGSVAIVIRPYVRDGQFSDYVLRTRLAVRDAGWNEVDELAWIKPSAPPLGNRHRPRRSWESILWFSNSTKPFCDPRANGVPTNRIGVAGKKGYGDWKHQKNGTEHREGIARCRDYVEVSASHVHKEDWNTHPAQFPSALAEWLIRLLSPPAGLVGDPFLGSGTTGVAAQNTGRRFVGWDINEEYLWIASKRLLARAGRKRSGSRGE